MSAHGPSTVEILPAIDLRAGRVVRLRQGDFAREQVYDDDPAGVALGFASAGAGWIHIVDLDGARSGERRQTAVIGAVVAAMGGGPVRLQVAGGLRDARSIAAALSAGADRIVLGTIAITNQALVAQAIGQHGPDRIAVALDVRNGLAVGQGWTPGAPATPVEPALEALAGLGVATFVVTAIERDGLLGGPDLALLGRMVERTDAVIIASGGISRLADIEAVGAVGCRGAIVGRALYDGRIDLAEAIAAGQRVRSTG